MLNDISAVKPYWYSYQTITKIMKRYFICITESVDDQKIWISYILKLSSDEYINSPP